MKLLPDGEPEPLTKMLGPIYGPAFSFDGTRIAFTYFTNGRTEPAWNTLTVPATGGLPSLLLSNSAGLTWIAPHQLLYSEIESGIHMGIVTSTDDRADRREVYVPSHEHVFAVDHGGEMQIWTFRYCNCRAFRLRANGRRCSLFSTAGFQRPSSGSARTPSAGCVAAIGRLAGRSTAKACISKSRARPRPTPAELS